jgi:hypothetical protein
MVSKRGFIAMIGPTHYMLKKWSDGHLNVWGSHVKLWVCSPTICTMVTSGLMGQAPPKKKRKKKRRFLFCQVIMWDHFYYAGPSLGHRLERGALSWGHGGPCFDPILHKTLIISYWRETCFELEHTTMCQFFYGNGLVF